MTAVEELQLSIAALPADDFARLRQWLLETDWQRWDEQLERDATAGRLDFLIEEAKEAKRTGKLEKL